MRRIVFVGGHHTPALAVCDALARKFKVQPRSRASSLRSRSSKFKIFWIGHKHSMWGDKSVSAEYQEVTRRGISFYDLKAGKLYKTFHPLKLIRLPFGFLQAFYYLLKIRPDIIVSFGGYLAPPVVIGGFLLRIPSVTHEQTVEGGWANRLVSRFAKKVFVSWEESLEYFPKDKAIVTGNPLRKSIFAKISNIQYQITNKFQISNSKLETIYITGGKQGSHLINGAVKDALPQLLGKYNVIHQCGRSTVCNDWAQLTALVAQLPKDQRARYILKDYFSEGEIGAVFNSADLVISRAGANIVYELAALGKPAVLIPIPWVSHDEQRKNAQILVDVGLAVVLEEKSLTSPALMNHIIEVFRNFEKYMEGGKRAQKLVRLDAAEKIASEVTSLIT